MNTSSHKTSIDKLLVGMCLDVQMQFNKTEELLISKLVFLKNCATLVEQNKTKPQENL